MEALWRHLAPHASLLPWHVEPAEAREKCDLLVLAAANQLGAHNDLGLFAAHLEKIGLPMVVVGLGAQAPNMASEVRLTPGAERWARVLASLAPSAEPNIGVRGEFTRRVLERLGLGQSATTVGCPSNFLNDSPDFYARLKRAVEQRRIERLCVAAGSRHFAGTREIERRLFELVGETGGLYVAQADLAFVRWARGEAADEAIREFLAPSLSADDFARWRQRHAACFNDATSWLEAMRSVDFALGARFHGVMLAIQAGAPGGVIAHDSRTLELCQTIADSRAARRRDAAGLHARRSAAPVPIRRRRLRGDARAAAAGLCRAVARLRHRAELAADHPAGGGMRNLVSNDADVLVVGAGVVGLAVARALRPRSVIVVEARASFGEETSSRNSEVIHSGIYYPAGSLKARLCVRGREMLYAFCECARRRAPALRQA